MNEKRKDYHRTVIPGLLLSLGTAGVLGYNNLDNKIEASQHQSQQDDASREAKRLGQELGRAGKDTQADITTWQGIIVRKTPKGTEYIGNPIVLSLGSAPKSAPSADEASPSYYGVIETPDGKNFMIAPHEFTEQDEYLPYDGNYIGPRTTSAYITSVNQINSKDAVYEVFAFDGTGESQVINPDGSLLSPGLVLPQDRK